MVTVFKNDGKRSTAKNYCPVSLLSVVIKVLRKLVNNRIVDHLEKRGLFSVLGLLDQLQILSQLYLIELLGPLTGLGLFEPWHLNLMYETLWTGVRSGLLTSVLRRLCWFHLTSLITMVLLM